MTDATTKSTPFAPCDHVDHHLFAVQPDIPLLDALEHASIDGLHVAQAGGEA